MSKKKLLIIIGVVVVVGVIIYLNIASDTTRTTKVQAEKAARRELVEMVSASGRIQPQTKVNITAEVSGEILALLVKEGDRVNTGDLLVVLDTIRLRTELDQAKYALTEGEARLDGAEASHDQAQEEFQRQEKLYKDNHSSETVYNDAKYRYLNAKAAYEATQAQTKQLEARYAQQADNLSKAKMVAPMPGIITFVDCEVGEIAPAQTAFTQGKTLMTISNLSVFEVEVEVDETEINKVDLGQLADIEVDAFPDTVFDGAVVEIGNTALLTGMGTQDQSTNFNVKVIFKDPNVRIRPGMSATVDIITNRKEDALSIPYSSIVMRSFDIDSLERARAGAEMAQESSEESSVVAEVQAAEGDQAQGDTDSLTEGQDSLAEATDTAAESEGKREELKGVFVIREGKARFVPVESGIADQTNIEITENLAEGDSVVSGPYGVLRTIKDGDNIEITGNK
jgi:HlyD family secretion protein